MFCRPLLALALVATTTPALAQDHDPCDWQQPPPPCWIEPWYCNPPREPPLDDRPMPTSRPFDGQE